MTSNGSTQKLREQSHTSSCRDEKEACQRGALPGRLARGCGRSRRRRRGARNSQDTAHLFVGGA